MYWLAVNGLNCCFLVRLGATKALGADIRSEYFRDAYTLTFQADRVVQGVVDALVILLAGGRAGSSVPTWPSSVWPRGWLCASLPVSFCETFVPR